MITVLGSINVDLVAKATKLPRPGETVSGHSFATEAGGKGANQALAARRAGTNVRLVGAVGKDGFADTALTYLIDAGVDLSDIQRVDKPTGSALISVSDDGENSIIVIPGANGTLTGDQAREAIVTMSKGDVLMLQLEIPAGAVELALTFARIKVVTTVLNIAPFTPEARSLSKLADIVIANETEFRLLIGDDSRPTDEFEAALRRLHDESSKSFIVTLGAEGAIAIWGGEIYRARCLKIKPVDTVGAGDTFCGYIAAGLCDGIDFQTVLERAAIAGSLACLRSGAQAAIPALAEVHGQIG